MDTEVEATVARIDERTGLILDGMEKQAEALANHESRDREDFKEVHARISKVERKQNWILGVGSAIIFAGSALVAFLRHLFGG